MNNHLEELIRLFKEELVEIYDFSQAPKLITRKKEAQDCTNELSTNQEWVKIQRALLSRTKDKRIYTKEYVEGVKNMYAPFFKERGPLKGNVLDIGGGWGLFRQWWKPNNLDSFIVCDPGVARLLGGPHQPHQLFYTRAFSLCMTFVEGFGEAVPFKNELFDICLIAATLDHCLYPAKVVEEGYRCLKPGGTMLVMQTCHSPQSDTQLSSIYRRALKVLKNPAILIIKIFTRLRNPVVHLSHFKPGDITLCLEKAGFSSVKMTLLSNYGHFAFEAVKPLNQKS